MKELNRRDDLDSPTCLQAPGRQRPVASAETV